MRQFHFIDQRDGEIFERNATFSIRVGDGLIAAKPESAGSFTRINLFRGAQIGPKPIRSPIDV
jgi:hypothetical protein